MSEPVPTLPRQVARLEAKHLAALLRLDVEAARAITRRKALAAGGG